MMCDTYLMAILLNFSRHYLIAFFDIPNLISASLVGLWTPLLTPMVRTIRGGIDHPIEPRLEVNGVYLLILSSTFSKGNQLWQNIN